MAVDVAARARAALTENLPLKLLSLAFALVLYSLVHGQEQRANVLVNVSFLKPDRTTRELITQIPPKIEVELRGARSIITDIQDKGIPGITLDLREGNQSRVIFEASLFRLPPGVTVDRVDPPSLELSWEDHVTRDVPVQASVVGAPAAGYVVKGQPLVEPPTIRVHGPKSWVLTLQSVRAAPFDATGLTEGKHTQNNLPVDPARTGIELDAISVSVTVEVVREVAERAFQKLAVEVVGVKGRAQPAEVDARLSCPPEILGALRTELLVPRVQVATTSERGSEALPVELPIPGCDVKITPATVIVRWGAAEPGKPR